MTPKMLRDLLNPKLSPALYVLAFFLAVPLLVYGVMQTTLEEGAAATGGDASVDFTNISTGQSVDEGDTMSINVGYDAGECVSTLNVADGNESIYSAAVEDSGTLAFNYTFDAPTRVGLVASLVPMSGQAGACAQTRYDTAILNVVPDALAVSWLFPVGGEIIMTSPEKLSWTASGYPTLATTDYVITAVANVPAGGVATVVKSGNLGEAGRCTSPTASTICSYNWDWHAAGYSGVYDITITLTSPDPGVNLTASDIANNVTLRESINMAPRCTLSGTPSTIDSGSTVAFSASATDDDPLGNGLIEFGDNGSASISPNGATVNHIYTNDTSTSKTYTAKATFTDVDGAKGSCTVNTTVRGVTNPPTPNHAPVFSSTGGTKATVGETYSYTLAATDADGDRLSYGWTKKPSWLAWSASEHKLYGAPAADDVNKTFRVSVNVSDGEATTTQTYLITVVGEIAGVSSEPPVVTIVYPTLGVQVGCGRSKIKWEATDSDGTVASIKLEYSTDGETWTLIAEGVDGTETSYDWDVCSLTYGTYYIMVTALDDTGVPGADQSEAFSIVDPTSILSGPDIINWKPESSSTVATGKPTISADFVATSAAVDAESVIVKVDDVDVTVQATVTENGFSYLPEESLDNSEHSVTVSVSDVDGRMTELEYTFTISAGEGGLSWTVWSAIICGVLAVAALIIAWVWKRNKDKNEKTGSGTKVSGENIKVESWEPRAEKVEDAPKKQKAAKK